MHILVIFSHKLLNNTQIYNLISVPQITRSAADLEMLQNDRLKFLHNPLIAYLNINSLRNKLIDLGKILKDLPLDYLIISETKLDEFPKSPI